MFVKKKAGSLKKVNLDVDDRLVEVGFQVSNKDRERLREEAFRKKISQGTIMRRVLKDHLKDEEQRRKDLGVKLEVILDSCVGWFGGFEIDGDEGFVERMYASSLMLEDLSDVQWERVKKQILVGWKGYGRGLLDQDRPSIEEFTKKFLKLNPSEKQKAWLEGRSDEVEEEVKKDLKEVKEDLEEEEDKENDEGEDFEGEGEGEGKEEDLEEEEEEIQIELIED